MAVLLCISVVIASSVFSISASASLQSEIDALEKQSRQKEAEINRLKQEKKEPQAIANAIHQKMAVIQ